MTKAKIMLTALVVLAITGGALAFKAQKGAKIYCTAELGKIAAVDCPTLNNWTTTAAGERFLSTCTAVPFEECVQTSIKFQQ